MSIFNPGSLVGVGSSEIPSTEQPPAEDVKTLQMQLLTYAREHRDQVLVSSGKDQYAIILKPSGWQDGSPGQELARRYQEAFVEERVQNDPESFFSKGTKWIMPESRRPIDPLSFLDREYADFDEFCERAREFVSGVLLEIVANNKQLRALIESLQEIKNAGLSLNAGVRDEAARVLRKVRHDQEDSVFKIFSLDPDVLPILRIEDGQKNSDIKKLAYTVSVASAETDKLTAELTGLMSGIKS